MNWYFMRHGQIASNLNKVYSGRSEEALTEFGREQVRQSSSQFCGIDIDAIYASPLRRTQQTAGILVDELNWEIPVKLDDHFNEIKMGPWEGLPEADVAAGFPEQWEVWNTRPAELQIDGRETLAQIKHRVVKGMRSIGRAHPGKSVLIVTHVAIIRVVTLFAAHRDLNEYKTVAVENARLVRFSALDL